MKIGIKQISEISGYSIATVSNVLNKKKGVSSQTADAILQIARENGYLTENIVKSIKLVIYKKHGLVVSDTPFFGALIEGVEGECRAQGYPLEICNLNSSSRSFDEILKELLNDHTTAILLLATELEEEDLKLFDSTATPIMLLDNWFASMKYNATLINNIDSAFRAVSYLVEKGHRTIGYLKSSKRINNFSYRNVGYNQALLNAGLSADPRYAVPLTPTMEGAYTDMDAYLRGKPELPTAYFADNDIIAFGVIKALKQHGHSVPDDVSIVGFDDMPFCEISSPALTTIRVFKREMGALAVKNLLDLIRLQSPVPTKIEVSTEFIERDSVKYIAACSEND